MSKSHKVKGFDTNSGRFSGYQLKRDLNNNIIMKQQPINQPEYWATKAITKSQGFQPYQPIRKVEGNLNAK
ncbi:MAG: hypothetical protein ACOCUI_00635 [bacterium]